MPLLSDSISLVVMILALLIAIIGHEIMHGFVALKFGDSTAYEGGRLSLNPLVHIDPLGSVIIPALLFLTNAPFLFGWAKPVPVRMDHVLYQGGYFGAFAVSAAGVAYNFLLALCASIFIFLLKSNFTLLESSFFLVVLFYFLMQLLVYNIILGIFNCLPIPPLDGSNMLSYLGLMMKIDAFAKLFERIPPVFGMIAVLVFLSTPLSSVLTIPVQSLIQWLL